jgi:capsular polysaccharide biosynthesis protein
VPHSQPPARRQFDFIKRQGGFIALITLLAIGAAAAFSLTQPKVYRAQTSIVVGQGGGIFQPQYGNVFQPFTQTMSSLLKSEIVANTVIRELGVDETPKSLLSQVHVSSTPSSAVIQVSFDSNDRAYAVRTLGTMASAFTSLVEQKLGGPQGAGNAGSAPPAPPITATVFDPAHASSTPVSPRPGRTMAFAGVIGLGLGILLALLRDALDDRIRGRDEMEELFAAPVIAELPTSMLGRRAVGRTGDEVLSSLRAVDPVRHQLTGNGTRGTLVVITSSVSGEGKSTVAANLAAALSLAGQDVICVDADPTPPRLRGYFELGQTDGTAPEQRVGVDLAASLRDVAVPDDSYHPSGSTNASGGRRGEAGSTTEPGQAGHGNHGRGRRGRIQLLEWGKEAESRAQWAITGLGDLKERASYVLVDTPPLTSSTTLALLGIADETIVVTREKKTTKAQAKHVRDTLERLHVPNYSVVAVGTTSNGDKRGLRHIFSRRAARARR